VDERRNRPPGAGRARELASQDGERVGRFCARQSGRLTFGLPGSAADASRAENFLYQAKADAVSVPYKGEAPALAGLVGGEISFALTNMAAAIPHVQGGRIRALGVTSTQRSAATSPRAADRKDPAALRTRAGSASWRRPAPPKAIVEKVYEDTRKSLEID